MAGISNSTDRFNGAVTSLAIKVPVRAVSTSNLTLVGTQTVNGVALVSGDRVLVNAQTDATENGIYDVTSTAWDRSPDWDGNRDATELSLVMVNKAVGSASLYQCDTSPPITIGSTAVNFSIFVNPSVLLTNPLSLAELAAPLASVAGFGQIWVRDDVPNVLIFTDDAGTNFVLGAGAGQFDVTNWNFDTSVSMADPGAGDVRFNNASPASVTQMAFNDVDADGNNHDAVLFPNVAVGDTLRVKDADDVSVDLLYSVNNTAQGTGWWRIDLSHIAGTVLPDSADSLNIEISPIPSLEKGTTGGAIPVWDLTKDRYVTNGARGVLLNPATGETRLSTSDSVLSLESASRVQSTQSFYVSYISNTDALIMGADSSHYSIGTGSTSNKYLDLWADAGGQPVRVKGGSTFMISERAAALPDIAGFGQFWIKSDVPNTAWFTDDTGQDFQLGTIGNQSYNSDFIWTTGSSSTANSGSVRTINSGATFEFDDNATLDFGSGNDATLSFNGTDFVINAILSTTDFNVTGFADINLNGRVVPQSLSTPISTTAALEAVGNAINTSAQKVAGTAVFNTTTNRPLWSVGNADASVWVDATGATVHTPV